MIKKFKQKVKKILFPLYIIIIKKLSIQPKKIVFDNFLGKGYGDNPKYICQKLLEDNLDYDCVWLLLNMDEELPKGVRKVKYGSFRAYYELATAGVWVDNVRNTHRPEKKEGQIVLQTWHGGFPLKEIEMEIEEQLSEEYIRLAKLDGSICDGILADNSLIEDIIRKSFWLNDKAEILRFGLPRNDKLFDEKFRKESAIKVRNYFSLTGEEYVVLYAPTFREDNSKKGYKLDFSGIQSALEEKTGKKCVIFGRLHPNEMELMEMDLFRSLLNATKYPDIQELYCIADCVISDYSSVPLEFSAFFRKPVMIAALDYEEYIKNRKLRLELETYPFPVAYTNEEMLSNIRDFSLEKYLSNIDTFFERISIFDSGNATEKTIEWIEKKITEGINEKYRKE